MAKKSAGKLAEGIRVLVKSGVVLPEFPTVSVGGWAGTISETTGKGDALKCIIEWDNETLKKLPPEYIKHCENSGLYHRMACFPASDLEIHGV